MALFPDGVAPDVTLKREVHVESTGQAPSSVSQAPPSYMESHHSCFQPCAEAFCPRSSLRDLLAAEQTGKYDFGEYGNDDLLSQACPSCGHVERGGSREGVICVRCGERLGNEATLDLVGLRVETRTPRGGFLLTTPGGGEVLVDRPSIPSVLRFLLRHSGEQTNG